MSLGAHPDLINLCYLLIGDYKRQPPHHSHLRDRFFEAIWNNLAPLRAISVKQRTEGCTLCAGIAEPGEHCRSCGRTM